MPEPTIYFWTDRAERAYVHLRHDGSHWRLEWGYRDPPASDNHVQRGEHVTSVPADALDWMLQQICKLSDDPDDPARAERKLREALQVRES